MGLLVFLIAVPFGWAAYLFVRNRRPYPPRGRKLGGEYTNNEPLVELNIDGTAFPEDAGTHVEKDRTL